MAAPRRTKFQIEDNRRDITRLYLRGKIQPEIAELLGISRAMVAYDLKAIQEQWRGDTVRDLDADKAWELAKIDELERTYWAIWESSRETRDGNPAYLGGVLKCIQRRAKLLGLDAPAKREHAGPGGGPIPVQTQPDLSKLSTEELLELRELLGKTDAAHS